MPRFNTKIGKWLSSALVVGSSMLTSAAPPQKPGSLVVVPQGQSMSVKTEREPSLAAKLLNGAMDGLGKLDPYPEMVEAPSMGAAMEQAPPSHDAVAEIKRLAGYTPYVGGQGLFRNKLEKRERLVFSTCDAMKSINSVFTLDPTSGASLCQRSDLEECINRIAKAIRRERNYTEGLRRRIGQLNGADPESTHAAQDEITVALGELRVIGQHVDSIRRALGHLDARARVIVYDPNNPELFSAASNLTRLAEDRARKLGSNLYPA